jgi:hypothetical protein
LGNKKRNYKISLGGCRCCPLRNKNFIIQLYCSLFLVHYSISKLLVPCSIFNFNIPCSLFIIQFQHSLFLVHYSISTFLVPCSLFNFKIPCSLFIIQFQHSLFIIQIKLNSQAGGQMVSSLERHERAHRLRGHKRWTYSTFIIQFQHSLFLVPCSSFKFNIPCSLFIIQIKLNSQAGGLMVFSLARHEREHRLWGHKRWTYSTFIIQFQHSLFLVHYSISTFLVPCSSFKSNSTHMPEAKWYPQSRDTSESIVCGGHKRWTYSTFIIQFQHSLFLVHYSNQTQLTDQRPNGILTRGTRARASFVGDTNDGHIVLSSFNFNIPCSLFIIQIKLNSEAGGQMVSSLARHERAHRL